MLKYKNRGNSTRFTEEFIDRLDNYKADEDYNPYDSIKKQSKDENDLFNSNIYEKESSKKDKKIKSFNVIVLIAIYTSLIIFGIYKLVIAGWSL